jgi:hypothetical protein
VRFGGLGADVVALGISRHRGAVERGIESSTIVHLCHVFDSSGRQFVVCEDQDFFQKLELVVARNEIMGVEPKVGHPAQIAGAFDQGFPPSHGDRAWNGFAQAMPPIEEMPGWDSDDSVR